MGGVIVAAVALVLVAGLAGGLFTKFVWPTIPTPDDEPRRIRATNLALVDEQGRERAVLKLIDGRPIFALSDEYRLPLGETVSTSRVAIGILQDGAPGLELTDPNGKKRIAVAVAANGTSLFELHARNSKARIALRMTADGMLTLQSFDDAGNPRANWQSKIDA
jgi:hypothetical protein